MSVQPAVGTKPAGTKKGTAARVAELSRRIKALETTPVALANIDGAAIAPGSITTGRIEAGSITTIDIKAFTITANEIKAFTITANEIKAETITATQIATGTLTARVIKAGSIEATHIQAGSVVAAIMTAGAIETQHIRANQVTTDHIQIGGLGGTAISPLAISTAHLQAGSVKAGKIEAGAVEAQHIVVGGMNAATVIAPGSIITGLMGANSISAAHIQTDAVGADEILVTNLEAVASAMGTITGGLFQTNTTGARVQMGTNLSGARNGIIAIDATNAITLYVNASTGDIEIKGKLTQGSTGLGNVEGVTTNVALFSAGGNLLTNGQFTTTDISQWNQPNNATVAHDAVEGLAGPGSLKATATATGAVYAGSVRFPAVAGLPWSASGFIRPSSTAAGARPVGVFLRCFNAAGAVTAESPFTKKAGVPGAWTKLTVNGYVLPANTTQVMLYFYVDGVSSIGETFHLDAPILEQRAVASGSQIIANSITAAEVAAGAITAGKITVTELSAITQNVGSLIGGTVTGSAIYTSTDTNNRVEITSAGLVGRGAGVVKLNIPMSGTATFDGKLLAKGVDMPWNAGGPAQINWYNGSQIHARVEGHLYPNSDYPYATLNAYRGPYPHSGVQIESEQSGYVTGVRANDGGIFAYHGGKSTQLMNPDGNMSLYGGLFMGGFIQMRGDVNRHILFPHTGFANVTLFNNEGTLRTEGTQVITGSIGVGSEVNAPTMNASNAIRVTGGGQLNFTASAAYLAADWGIRFHGGNTQTAYGGWTSPHIVSNGSSGGASYSLGQSYAVLHNNFSDRKTKTNVRDVFTDRKSAMARVRGLRPRRYDRALLGGGGIDEAGFIAEEVELIDPDLIKTVTMPDGGPSMASVKILNPMEFVVLLTSALQSLDSRLAAIESATL